MTQKHFRAHSGTVLSFLLAGLAVVASPTSRAETPVASAATTDPPSTQQVQSEGYRQHLDGLRKVVIECEHAMNRDTCQPARVGPDNQVSTSSGVRTVEYAWLRKALLKASDAESAKDPQRAREQAAGTLREVERRLQQESDAQQEPTTSSRDLTQTRRTLSTILAKGEFAQVEQPGALEKLKDIFLDWLRDRLRRVGRSGWSSLMTNLLFLSVIVLACSALVWWFARQVIRRGLALPPPGAPHSAAPSARDWERWLEDGRRQAEQGHWREAIHDVYWGAISRQESCGLWPADRARTPREYLDLLAANSEKRVDLVSLTRSFERTWYGGKDAREQDFNDACALLERLGSR